MILFIMNGNFYSTITLKMGTKGPPGYSKISFYILSMKWIDTYIFWLARRRQMSPLVIFLEQEANDFTKVVL